PTCSGRPWTSASAPSRPPTPTSTARPRGAPAPPRGGGRPGGPWPTAPRAPAGVEAALARLVPPIRRPGPGRLAAPAAPGADRPVAAAPPGHGRNRVRRAVRVPGGPGREGEDPPVR